MSEKTVFYYATTGRIRMVANIGAADVVGNTQVGESVLLTSDEVSVDRHVIVDGAVVARPVMPLVLTDLEFAVSESLTISGIPHGTEVVYPDGALVVDDGFIEWNTLVPGIFTFTLTKFPYIDEVLRATVTEA